MTDVLTTMLRQEASAVLVPPTPTATILQTGKALRRRHRIVVASGALLVVGIVVASAVGLLASGSSDRAIDPVRLAEFERWGAVAVGRDVYVGDQHVRWDSDVKAMYYTSEGVVVRGTDYALVRADGEVIPIEVNIPDRIPGFEPDSTRFAYADPAGSRWDVVVHDAATDEELARVEVQGSFTWGGWEAPPVSIDGDLAWVHFDGHWTEVDWRTGEVREVPDTSSVFEIQNGRYTVQSGDRWQVRRMSDSELVGRLDLRPGWYATFSPDGRFMRSFPNDSGSTDGTEDIVHDVSSGRSREITDPGEDFGWTPDGQLLVVHQDSISTCAPITATCQTRPFARGASDLRIGGNPYES